MRQSKWFAAAAIFSAAVAQADVRLPSAIGNNMVLQRDMPARIWGWADADETVTVTVGDFKTSVKPTNGKWEVKLPARAAGEVPDVQIAGKNTITLTNILAGDIWICSGQSNMQWSVSASNNAQSEIAGANFPKIRLLRVPNATAATPQDDFKGEWVQCDPKTIPNFTAVGYFFGRELHQTLNVPIGLVHTNWGGTPAEAWTPLPKLEEEPDFAKIIERSNNYPKEYPGLVEKYEKDLAAHPEKVEKAKAENKPVPQAPRKPAEPSKYPHLAAVLYNAMIHPITPMNIKGAIWYQGETNAGRSYQYRKLLPTMITSWREAWGQGDFPFGIVQLANYQAKSPNPGESGWAELREAQTMTADNLPNTGLAVTIDIGEEKDIHPRNKQDVGRRLALWALYDVYGQKNVVYSGPAYDPKTLKVENGAIRVGFQHVGGGLQVKGEKLTSFAIAGADKAWKWADAKIDGNTIVVSSPEVKEPVAVRYGWANNPDANLFNKEGLPAIPFRSDDWPGATVNNK